MSLHKKMINLQIGFHLLNKHVDLAYEK